MRHELFPGEKDIFSERERERIRKTKSTRKKNISFNNSNLVLFCVFKIPENHQRICLCGWLSQSRIGELATTKKTWRVNKTIKKSNRINGGTRKKN